MPRRACRAFPLRERIIIVVIIHPTRARPLNDERRLSVCLSRTQTPKHAQTLKSRDSKPRDVTYGDDLEVRREDKGTYARTETTDVTSAPEFQNKAFIMSVPRVNNARALHPTAVEDLLDGKDWPGFGVTEGGAAEGVALGDGPPALVCQLYGARSAGHSVMGQDVLMGQGYVEFFGATVQRLARGEAVSMTVSLEHPEGRAPSQLSLQVTMLDTAGGAGGAVARTKVMHRIGDMSGERSIDATTLT